VIDHVTIRFGTCRFLYWWSIGTELPTVFEIFGLKNVDEGTNEPTKATTKHDGSQPPGGDNNKTKDIAKVHPVHVMDAEQRQLAADLWTKPTDLSRKSAYRLLVNHIHHRHSLLLKPKADTHFTVPRGDRKLSQPGWLITHRDGFTCPQIAIQS